jgi:D-aspartate ligase
MGGIEYKRDARSGKFLMIEPTVGRVDWQEEVATLNGINIPLAAYLHETGSDARFVTVAVRPTIWRDTARHWKSSNQRSADEKARAYDAYWRLDDPLPALVHGFSLGTRVLRRGLRHVEPRLSGKALEKA